MANWLRRATLGVAIWAALAGLAHAGLGDLRPRPRPETPTAGETAPESASEGEDAPPDGTAPDPAASQTQTTETPALAAPETVDAVPDTAANPDEPPRDPNRGTITNLPLPRYVSLKGKEGNARRGPGLTNRIDWVFVRAGMPLKITAEHEHWRRIEDAEGVGGWVHYALLSGVRSAQVTAEMAEFHAYPSDDSAVDFKAEKDVVGWIQECNPDWCRLAIDGEKGWVRKSAIWGVDPSEVIE